jgi:predicted DNA-binding protein (MmcQ/YjbR family)
MIGEQHLRLYHFCSFDQLLRRHRIRLVARQEGNVDVLDVSHFWNVLRITSDFSVISLKCQPERIEELKEHYDCIGNPYNESHKHWIGINPTTASNDLLKELTRNSYEIAKAKYKKK